MPDNRAEPSHVLMDEAAKAMPFRQKIADAGRGLLPKVGFYYDRLVGLSSRVDIWHTVYNHPLADADAIVEWVKATGLKPYLDPLEANEQKQFLSAYGERIAAAYPAHADGKVLLRFPRLFIVAVR
jgi:trans-aconitate 2-methyltransferase